mgnify:CR=1 FL=1
MGCMTEKKVAVVTGASSGIGEATVRSLAKDGWHVVVGARRTDRLQQLASEIGGEAYELDVTSDVSVSKFVSHLERVDLLVNNAGGAKGLEPLVDTSIEDWQWMYSTNVLGTVRMIQALMPKLERVPDLSGLIINVGSIAGWTVYEGGSGYNTAKHGVRVISRALRLENHDVRVTEILAAWPRTFPWCASRAMKSARPRCMTASSTSWQKTLRRPSAGWPPNQPTSTWIR